MRLREGMDLAALNQRGQGFLPCHLGLEVVVLRERDLVMQREVRPTTLAPNGFLHAASVAALADTACGCATIARLPEGVDNFTTTELKTSFLGTATADRVQAVARAVHGGRNAQVWDATVTEAASGLTQALFRCTQMVLFPRR